MVGLGFEPRKAEPVDLQSTPFGHFGTPPHRALEIESFIKFVGILYGPIRTDKTKK